MIRLFMLCIEIHTMSKSMAATVLKEPARIMKAEQDNRAGT